MYCYSSFQEIVQTECGSSRGSDTHVLFSECKADISAHLAGCHLSHCLDVTESTLILARAGIRGLSSTLAASITIFPKHGHLLGRFWRPPKSCQCLIHSGKTTSVSGRHVINWQMAEEIYLLFGISTPVGSPVCTCCRKKHAERIEPRKKSTNVDGHQRAAKHSAKLAINTYTADVQTTPAHEISRPDSPILSPGWSPGGDQFTTHGNTKTKDVLNVYNTAMDEIARKASSSREPLDLRIESWNNISVKQQQHCIQKATEDCKLVCNIIAPNNGQQLFEAMASSSQGSLDEITVLWRNSCCK